MRCRALATDYDGTIATGGLVPSRVVEAMAEFRQSGRPLILVTGRELPDIIKPFPAYKMFDRIVAENGALVYDPATGKETLLAEPVSEALLNVLTLAKIQPLTFGRSIIATREPHETVVLEAIKKLGLELQIIFNKGAVMVLPPGVNKATGLDVALAQLGVKAADVVAVGDAENDHAFLSQCGTSVAVANALPAVKERVTLVTKAERGAGVIELIEQILSEDSRLAS